MTFARRFAVLLLLATSIAAFAHGNMDHILGKVKSILGDVVTVENHGDTTEVLLVPATTYETNGKPGKQKDLKVGDRVVIHAMKIKGQETAHEVRLVHPSDAK
jgi:hypothetical protein